MFASEEDIALEVTWSAKRNIIEGYRAPDTSLDKPRMETEINTLTSTCGPRGLNELMMLGRRLKRRVGDILTYFDRPPPPAMAPPKPSTAASNTYAALPSDSGTSPTTSTEHSSKQEGSDPNYTPNYKEPLMTVTQYING